MTKQQRAAVAANVVRITKALGFGSAAEVLTADTQRAVLAVDAKFARIRRALIKQYGDCAHNVPVGRARRRSTWIVEGKGTIVATGALRGPVKLTFATMPAIRL